MNPNLVHAFIVIYRLSLRLYPRRFRAEFGEEMTAVFSEAITEAAQTTRLNLLLFCWRELHDYPFSLLGQHWQNMETISMSTIIKRLIYLLGLIILGLVWWPVDGTLLAFSPVDHNGWNLLALLTVYLPFVLAAIAVICWLFSVPVTSVIRRISPNVWLAVGLLALVALFLPASIFGDQADVMTVIVQFWVAIASMALLLYSEVMRYSGEQVADKTELQNEGGNKTAVITLALSLLLLLKVLHKFYWLLIWDSTDDGLGLLWLIFLLPAVLFVGFFLSIVLPDGIKRVGFSYLLLMLALIIGVFALGLQVDYRHLTAQRAERVSQAIEKYYDQEGAYPPNLQRLVPRYILALPEPVIISGQAWCYDGGADYYRLGYVYREYWYDPRLVGKLSGTAGNVSELQPLCLEKVTTIQEQNPRFPYEYWTGNE
jgi:hypothetical protein